MCVFPEGRNARKAEALIEGRGRRLSIAGFKAQSFVAQTARLRYQVKQQGVSHVLAPIGAADVHAADFTAPGVQFADGAASHRHIVQHRRDIDVTRARRRVTGRRCTLGCTRVQRSHFCSRFAKQRQWCLALRVDVGEAQVHPGSVAVKAMRGAVDLPQGDARLRP
jgi:hypothetical protein